ncbi:hypothetical protein Vadar_025247 [Vaccinium darrowii]|uniref:Uncharacterized protein n=1 Tax=Vaccinium darrowii TaxID=229202 RepID=A0ACB7YYF3_9ERIC|nr:hypothetical protein Vadar_025247 [Vaccinium darrowii]
MGEEEAKRQGPITLDWDKLLPLRDDEPPPVLVVATTIVDDDMEQSQRDELHKMNDRELEEAIVKLRRTFETVGSKLNDGGAKIRANLQRYQAEIERRKLRRLEKVDDGCEKLTESKGPCFTSATDGVAQETPSSLPASQSVFATQFSKKLEENNTNTRTVNAFGSDLSVLGRCGLGKRKYNAKFPQKEKPTSTVSSRQSPFQCPTNLSLDGDQHVHNHQQNRGHLSRGSPRILEEKVTGFQSNQRKPSQFMRLNNMRPRNGTTVVLVDEEEPELSESMELAYELDESMKDSKIYYPSSDDPESIEICYSDLECLNPQAYLSSTIMNFYIRYLQQKSPTDRRRCDYHFFNTYFYNKLKEAVLKKNDQESYFIKFRRWWKGVNIFHKAYILLPIHETVHWSLVIICIPDKEDESGPILLHLDSLGLHSSRLIFENIKSFLREEWEYLNREEAPRDLPIADRIWKYLPRRIEEKPISVPQQRNDYDCGLFVLYFMERFIDEAPQRLKKKDLAMIGKKWFRPEEASDLRKKVKKILVDEFRNAKRDDCVSENDPLSSICPQGERSVQPIEC